MISKEQRQSILEKPLTEQIFMGSGEFSEIYCQRLRNQLNEAFSLLSGMQQLSCGGSNEPISQKDIDIEVHKCRQEIVKILAEISIGLLG